MGGFGRGGLRSMSEVAEDIAADIEGWDAIDDHRTGTAGDRRTGDWLAQRVKSVGLEPRRDDFELSRWVLGRCELEISGTVVEGVPLFDGGTTGPEGVVGGLGLLGERRGNASIGVGAFGNAASDAARALAASRRTNDYRAIVAVSRMDDRVTGLALQNADRFNDPFGPRSCSWRPSTRRGSGRHRPSELRRISRRMWSGSPRRGRTYSAGCLGAMRRWRL